MYVSHRNSVKKVTVRNVKLHLEISLIIRPILIPLDLLGPLHTTQVIYQLPKASHANVKPIIEHLSHRVNFIGWHISKIYMTQLGHASAQNKLKATTINIQII